MSFKPTHSLPAKVTAIILFLLVLLITVCSVLGVVFSAVYGVYDGATTEQIRAQIVEDYLYNISYDYLHYPPGITDSTGGKTGLFCEITDSAGNVLYTNFHGEAYIATSEVYFVFSEWEYDRFLNSLLHPGEEVDTTDAVTKPETVPSVPNTDEVGEEGLTEGTDDDKVHEAIGINIRLWGNTEALSGWRNVFFRIMTLLARYPLTNIIVGVVSLILTVCLFIFLMCAAGHRRNSDEVRENPLDRIPYDLFGIIVGGIEVLLGCLLTGVILLEANDLFALFVLGSIVVYIPAALVLLGFFMSTATRIKTGRIWRNTVVWKVLLLIFRFLRWIGRGISSFFRNLGLIRKTVIILAGLLVGNLILSGMANDGGVALLMIIVECPVLCVLIIWYAISLRKLQKGVQEIANGNLEYQIDRKHLPPACAATADELNRIGEGLSRAVDERMKSEHFRAELITNVSHDIKTPLTSIINYVDLIKKQGVTEEPLVGYVDVLDRQSARLKKLVEDLVEASKASSGVLTVELFPCELGVLLGQLEGEYKERLEAVNLTLCVRCPEAPLTVMADGRHLGRVFDNLMTNIIKYAQPGTRVYVDATNRPDGYAVITFRNTSGAPLNIPAEELMERFVRGDVSRHTEGSGLGLSIVQSLTELQKGTMTLTIDGDLFKVQLAFPLVGQSAGTSATKKNSGAPQAKGNRA